MAQQSAGAIWKKTINTKNGKAEILSIQIGDKKYTAWVNDYKKEAKHPDYKVFEDNYKPSEPTQEKQDPQDDLPF